jgi:hypothetical protein
METQKFSRRQALQATAVLGTALLLPTNKIEAMALPLAKTPGLTPDEITAMKYITNRFKSFKKRFDTFPPTGY